MAGLIIICVMIYILGLLIEWSIKKRDYGYPFLVAFFMGVFWPISAIKAIFSGIVEALKMIFRS